MLLKASERRKNRARITVREQMLEGYSLSIKADSKRIMKKNEQIMANEVMSKTRKYYLNDTKRK
jgi:hypothetical protein